MSAEVHVQSYGWQHRQNSVLSHEYMGENVVLRHLSEQCISWLLWPGAHKGKEHYDTELSWGSTWFIVSTGSCTDWSRGMFLFTFIIFSGLVAHCWPGMSISCWSHQTALHSSCSIPRAHLKYHQFLRTCQLFPKKQHVISCEHITVCSLSVPYILVNVRYIEQSFEYTFLFLFIHSYRLKHFVHWDCILPLGSSSSVQFTWYS